MQKSIDESPNFMIIGFFRGEIVELWRNFKVMFHNYTFFHVFWKLLSLEMQF
jgi:hypothetical protein